MTKGIATSALLLWCAAAQPLAAEPGTVNGFVGLETRRFVNARQQPSSIVSAVAELRAQGRISETLGYDLRLYARENLEGLGGGYGDATVAKLTWQSDAWRIDAGYDLLFWGVAEGRNLVNIINQRDQVRDPFHDQGLGQAMIALRYFAPNATFEAFVLPGFKPLNFGPQGRPWGLGLPVDGPRATFESSRGARHVDYALRVSGQWGDLDYGAFAFDGTLRQPQYRFDTVSHSLVPHYGQGRQIGVELQYTAGPAIYKFEGVRTRPSSDAAFWAAIFGFEYVLSEAFGRPLDASVFVEYYRDSRQNDPAVVFQNDVFLGTQFRFSNTLDTRLEIGAIIDLDYGGVIGSVGLETRITDQLGLSAKYTHISASRPRDGLFNARHDDQLSVGLRWNF